MALWHSTRVKTVAQNRRVRYDYEILDTLEAGIQLSGQEVKSCRNGTVNLQGAYVSLLSGKPVLKQATIAPYAFANVADFDPKRDRELLLRKPQIEALQSALNEKGVSLVPLAVKAGKHIKLDIALVRGKKRFDKRQKIKERQIDRAQRRGQDY